MDQPTLFLTAALASALAGTLLWIARAESPHPDPLTLWASAMACGAAGLLLTLYAAPDPRGTEIGKLLLLTGVGVSWAAARIFAGQSPRPAVAALGVVIWLLASQLPLFNAPGPMRLALSYGIGLAYTMAIMRAMQALEPLRARVPMLLVLGVHAALYLARIVLVASGLNTGYGSPLITVLLLEAQIHPIAIAFLLLAMTNERAARRGATALQEARNAAEARRKFLAHLSHEIRTPLNGVLGLAQHLRRDTALAAAQRQQVETMEAAGRHLLAIVNDALDLARIDAGQVELTFRPFNPLAAAEGCIALVRPAATDKRITLRVMADPAMPTLVAGDGTRLQQILLNVLWNAVKFTPEGGEICVRITAPEGLRFDVTDTGPGIPQDCWERLFQDFSPLDTTLGGTGLGLAISARLAARMGGRLSYRPGPQGRGARFGLELPWQATCRPAAATAGAPGHAHSADAGADAQAGAGAVCKTRLRLLVVDDVHANRFLLRAVLTAQGHGVTEAANCTEALAALAVDRFDAVLLDLHMPDTDGFETARRIRRMDDRTAAATRLLAVSADDAPETRETCRRAGMAGLITKPIDYDLLLAELGRLAAPARMLASA